METVRQDSAVEDSETQHYEVLHELGDCYTSVGRYEDAKNCYEKAASLAPDEAGPYVGLGVIAIESHLPDDAEIAFRVACRLDTRCAEGHCGLAMVAQMKGSYEKAFERYLKSLEIDGNNLTALLGLFQSSCQMGTFEKITYYLEMYMRTHPADTSVMFTLAALYMKDNRLEQSKNILMDVLALEPENKEAQNLLEEVEYNLSQSE